LKPDEGIPSLINTILKDAASSFDIVFHDGQCLNFAVAAHDAFVSIGLDTQIMAVMRSISQDNNAEWLSHVVLKYSQGSLHDPFELQTFDNTGFNAFHRWAERFNHIQSSMGEPQEEFWLEPLSMPIQEYIIFAQNTYGCLSDGKLIDMPELRQLIYARIIEHPLLGELKLAVLKNRQSTSIVATEFLIGEFHG
jgi:hypothetical protein